MDYSYLNSYSMVFNADYSSSNECYGGSFARACFADAYTSHPDHSLSFPDGDLFFDRPVTSVEVSPGFVSKSHAVSNATLLAAANADLNSYQMTSTPAPLGQLEQYSLGFPSFTRYDSFESARVSLHSQRSRTPLPCGDGSQLIQPSFPELSPCSMKRELTLPSSHTSPEIEPEPKRLQRKRGRPKLDRTLLDSSSDSSNPKYQRTSRLSHNQAERKYREGLNREFERLRRAVPTLPQAEEGNVMGQSKPSKAMVLAGAIDYIEKIEQERCILQDENDRLRGILSVFGGEKGAAVICENSGSAVRTDATTGAYSQS